MSLSKLRASDSDDQRRLKINLMVDRVTLLEGRPAGYASGGGGGVEIDGGEPSTTFDSGELDGGSP